MQALTSFDSRLLLVRALAYPDKVAEFVFNSQHGSLKHRRTWIINIYRPSELNFLKNSVTLFSSSNFQQKLSFHKFATLSQCNVITRLKNIECLHSNLFSVQKILTQMIFHASHEQMIGKECPPRLCLPTNYSQFQSRLLYFLYLFYCYIFFIYCIVIFSLFIVFKRDDIVIVFSSLYHSFILFFFLINQI